MDLFEAFEELDKLNEESAKHMAKRLGASHHNDPEYNTNFGFTSEPGDNLMIEFDGTYKNETEEEEKAEKVTDKTGWKYLGTYRGYSVLSRVIDSNPKYKRYNYIALDDKGKVKAENSTSTMFEELLKKLPKLN